MLRHSFVLMAAGDDLSVGLLPHQLRGLSVMAGMDPSSPATWALVEQLLARKDATTSRITYDSFLQVSLAPLLGYSSTGVPWPMRSG